MLRFLGIFFDIILNSDKWSLRESWRYWVVTFVMVFAAIGAYPELKELLGSNLAILSFIVLTVIGQVWALWANEKQKLFPLFF